MGDIIVEVVNQPVGFPVIAEIFREISKEIQFCICKDGIVISGADDPDCINHLWIPQVCIQYLQWKLDDDQEVSFSISLDSFDKIAKAVYSPAGSMSLVITPPNDKTPKWNILMRYNNHPSSKDIKLEFSSCNQSSKKMWYKSMRLFAHLHLSSQLHVPTFELQKLIQLLGHAHDSRFCVYPDKAELSSQSFRFKTSITIKDDGDMVKTWLLKADLPHSSCLLSCERLLLLSSKILKQLRQSKSCIISASRPFLLCKISPKSQACFSI